MKNVLGTLTVATVLLFAVSAMAQTKVVVIPLNGKKATGDAVAADVLAGKTFSNSSENNLVGTYVPPPTRTIGCTPSNLWNLTQCVGDCAVIYTLSTPDHTQCINYCLAISHGIDAESYGNRVPCIKLW